MSLVEDEILRKSETKEGELSLNIILSDLLAFSRQIGRKWILWVFLSLDMIALAAQTILPQLRIPSVTFMAVALLGFFWAGFQVYRDLLEQLPSRPVEPSPFELLPRRFEISLNQEIPQIEIWLYVANHQRKEIVITSLEVSVFNLSAGPSLESISHAGQIKVPRWRSELVMCRRTLNESEIRAIRRAQTRAEGNAEFRAIAQAKIGRRHLSQETRQMHSNGRVSGLDQAG